LLLLAVVFSATEKLCAAITGATFSSTSTTFIVIAALALNLPSLTAIVNVWLVAVS